MSAQRPERQGRQSGPRRDVEGAPVCSMHADSERARSPMQLQLRRVARVSLRVLAVAARPRVVRNDERGAYCTARHRACTCGMALCAVSTVYLPAFAICALAIAGATESGELE